MSEFPDNVRALAEHSSYEEILYKSIRKLPKHKVIFETELYPGVTVDDWFTYRENLESTRARSIVYSRPFIDERRFTESDIDFLEKFFPEVLEICQETSVHSVPIKIFILRCDTPSELIKEANNLVAEGKHTAALKLITPHVIGDYGGDEPVPYDSEGYHFHIPEHYSIIDPGTILEIPTKQSPAVISILLEREFYLPVRAKRWV